MANKPVRGLGTKLKIGAGAAAKSVANLTEIGGLSLTADTTDTTTLESDGGYREFIGGFKDGGEVTASGFFDPGTGNGQIELYELFESGDVEAMTIEFPPAINASWEFTGVVTGISTSTGIEDPITFEVTIKVSGKPTLTVG